MKLVLASAVLVAVTVNASQSAARWGAPSSAAIPEAGGYIPIPNAAVFPEKKRTYRAVYDATRAAKEPTQLVPAISMAGAALNAFAATGVPLAKARFAMVFHGPAMDGVLVDTQYRLKYGVANPNLKVLAELRKAGVELFVCGQNLAHDNIDPGSVSPDVRLASAAQIVLMTYENDGYALLSF